MQMMIVAIAVLGVVFCARAGAQERVSAPTEVYLLIGQSNMAGRAAIPEDAKVSLERCLMLDEKGQWIPARNPLNEFSTVRKEMSMQKLGPGYSFAKRMAAADPKAIIGLVVNARGGTSIEEWAKGQKLYEEAIRRAKVALASGQLKGILWHQGEGNAGDAKYLEKLKTLVSHLRSDLDASEVPFVCGEILGKHLVNDQLRAAEKEIPQCVCVSAEGMTSFDNLHFDTESAIKLGERYAEAMLRLQGRSR